MSVRNAGEDRFLGRLQHIPVAYGLNGVSFPKRPEGSQQGTEGLPLTPLPSTASLRTMRLAASLRTLSEDSAPSHTCACFPQGLTPPFRLTSLP